MRLLKLFVFLFFLPLACSQTLKDAGIFVRLNQKAVDYVAGLVSEALPPLLKNLNPPDTNAPSVKTSKTLIHTVTKPKTNISFIEGKGFRADVVFPFIRVSTYLEVSIFIFEYAGSFEAELHNLTLSMELHYSRNETIHRNVIEAPHCALNHSDLILNFPPDSALSSIRGELEDQIISKLRSAFCGIAVEALRFVDDQNMEEAVAKEPVVESDSTEFSPAELGASLCKPKTVVEEDATSLPVETDLNSSSISWSANLSMAFPPVFRKRDVVFGINGGVVMNGEAAQAVNMPAMEFNRSNIDSQMIGIAVSEYVPNTLLSHIYDNDLGRFSETFTAEHLPKALKKIGKLVCSKCYVTLAGSLIDKPVVQIDKNLGARLRVTANLSISFQGRQDMHEIIQATTTMHITVKPTIRHSRIYGDVSLSSVDVNVFELAVSGAFAKPLEQAVSFIVPKVLWPQVKRRLRFALNRRGFQLPVFCGLEFEHMKLFYVDYAAVLTTDFRFDIEMFVEKFKKYLQYKASLNPGLPKYLD